MSFLKQLGARPPGLRALQDVSTSWQFSQKGSRSELGSRGISYACVREGVRVFGLGLDSSTE